MNARRELGVLLAVLAAGLPCSAAAQNLRAEWRFERGNTLTSMGRVHGAVHAYTQAIQYDPTFTEAYRQRGNVLSGVGQLDGAIADFTQVIRLSPDDADAYRNRGIAYLRKGDAESAIADLTEVVRLSPQYAEVA